MPRTTKGEEEDRHPREDSEELAAKATALGHQEAGRLGSCTESPWKSHPPSRFHVEHHQSCLASSTGKVSPQSGGVLLKGAHSQP